jgi:hypothetical protein
MYKSDAECLYEAYRQIYKENLVDVANKTVNRAVGTVFPALGTALQRDYDLNKGTPTTQVPTASSGEIEIQDYFQHISEEEALDPIHINYIQSLLNSNASNDLKTRARTILNQQVKNAK